VHYFLINKHYNFSNSGYIFVDFSRYNIRLFTNDKWIEYLLKTGLRVVLIADRLAQPLALYWKHRCQQIVSIINTSDTRNEIEKKIQLSFLGQKMDEAIAKNSAIRRYWCSIFYSQRSRLKR
jgi:hypothetical protein